MRRSNSYRVALRKSGIPKEYIEELEKQLDADEQSKQQQPVAEVKGIREEKKTLFKRNYRGLQNKRNNGTLTRKNDGDIEQNEVTNAISTDNNSSAHNNEGHKDDEGSHKEVANGSHNRDNYSNSREQRGKANGDQHHDQSSGQFNCGHVLCLLCCCNYCVFLPHSVRSELRSSIRKDSNRSHLLEAK